MPPVSSFNSEHEISWLYQLPTTFPDVSRRITFQKATLFSSYASYSGAARQ